MSLKSEVDVRREDNKTEQISTTRIDVDVGAADVVVSLHLAQVDARFNFDFFFYRLWMKDGLFADHASFRCSSC
jgi:hypothetical protein